MRASSSAWVVLWVGLAAASGWAGGWRDVQPGVSTREDALRVFGEPIRKVNAGGKEILAFREPGSAQVQCQIDPTTGRVSRIDVFPLAVLDIEMVEGTYGPPCGKGPPPRGTACYVKRLTKDARAYLEYASTRMAVFLKPDGKQIHSFVFLPDRTAPPPRDPPPKPAPALEGEVASAGEEPPPASNAEAPAAEEDDGWAATTSFAPVTSKPPVERTVELGGKVVVTSHTYLRPPPPGKIAGRANIDGLIEARVKAEGAFAYASLLGRRDFVDPSRDRFDVPEAYGEVSFLRLRLTAGRTIVAWGAANLLNPTDVINPVDRTDSLVSEKRGSWMVRASALFEGLLLEGYYLPIPEAHILPTVTGIGADGTILSPSPWVVGSVPQDPAIPVRYQFGQTAPPRPRIDNPQVAARVAVSVAGADVRLGYGYLLDKLPSIRPTFDTSTLPSHVTVTVDYEYQRMHVFTLDLERTFGSLRVAGEAVAFRYLRPRPEDVERSFVLYVAGADYQFPQFFDDHRVHLFAEWTEARAIEGGLSDDFIGQLRHPFPRAILARASYHAGSSWAVEVTGIASVLRPDFLVTGRLTVSVSDLVKARLGGAYLGGDPAGFFGKYRDNRRVEAGLEAAF